MKETNLVFRGYLGRFTLIYVITYAIVAVLFLIIQGLLPASERVALDFFKPYRSLDFIVIIAQIIRGCIMALVLYPFYDITVRNKRGWFILFGALWGLAMLGSLEPLPGSIEGMIYTETTFLEHFMVMTAGAIQVLLFTWLFLTWENWNPRRKRFSKSGGEIHG